MAAFLLQVYKVHYHSVHFANFVQFRGAATPTLSVSCEHAISSLFKKSEEGVT